MRGIAHLLQCIVANLRQGEHAMTQVCRKPCDVTGKKISAALVLPWLDERKRFQGGCPAAACRADGDILRKVGEQGAEMRGELLPIGILLELVEGHTFYLTEDTRRRWASVARAGRFSSLEHEPQRTPEDCPLLLSEPHHSWEAAKPRRKARPLMPSLQAKDGTNLFFYDWGSRGGTPVVLIHGWPLTSASWEFQARVLADAGYRVIAYDRRGFGRSDWAGSGYEYNTLASDLNDLMEGLNLNGATLVGFSMGGGEVARYLSHYGQARVAKAVFISAVTPFLLKTDSNPEGVDGKVFEGIVAGLVKDRADFLSTFSHMFYNYSALHHTVSAAQIDFFHSMAMTASPDATIKLVRAWSETDFRGDVAKITIPALVIHGTGDKTVPMEVSGARMKALLANSETLAYDGEPHGLTNTVPDRLNEDLLRFLRTPAKVATL